ncbi:hypothetical protein BD410DRAFT_784285 [Rickenella mellea]|uniref:Mediator of RNA polymerase II transcription subunit 1 n=1 Tax=Rickenella mellea TaxID=50990 RepID=A0A4Y7QFM1_9AGAM|nr:hypothetical protein BD410DRAFT_784285 [Rickenella mellea]
MSEHLEQDKTILSVLEKFTAFNAFPNASPHNLHPFASGSSEPPVGLLKELSDAATKITSSLSTYAGLGISDPKSISLLRQHSALAHGLHTSEQGTLQRIDALRKRRVATYGEDIPLDRAEIVDWCISRLEHWGKSAGMEIFKEEHVGRMTVVLGGKVLVVDIDFMIDRSTPSLPRIDVANVKTSHATSSAATENTPAERSMSLDEFIKCSLRNYLEEVQAADSVPDSTKAAKMAHDFESHLKYLMKLDQLADEERDTGIRWFKDVTTLTSAMNRAHTLEAEAVARSLSASVAPLDIFLLRAHALALPFITSPSMSFLTYISPVAYLSILRMSEKLQTSDKDVDWIHKFDISLPALRKYTNSAGHRPTGVTTANLTLASSSQPENHSDSQHLPLLSNRPTFLLPVSSPISDLDHVFPEPPSGGNLGSQMWTLDFTEGGLTKGIVMTQSRMREIQFVVNPLSAVNDMGVQMMSFGYGSWVDLLLNPGNSPSEIYTAHYTSPSNLHPPLQLRLSASTAPVEPGFLLGRVRVRTLREVWAILEIVKEQCWLNESLRTCEWVPESTEPAQDLGGDDVNEATEADLQAILNGTFEAKRVPVNVFVPYQPTTDPLFGDDNGLPGFSLSSPPQSSPRIVMTVQTREASPSQVQITVGHDPTRPKGVRVDVNGSLPFTTIQVDKLEESARRGGIFGLAGKVWGWSRS